VIIELALELDRIGYWRMVIGPGVAE